MSKRTFIIVFIVLLLLIGVAVYAQKAQIANRLDFTFGTPRNISLTTFGLTFILPVLAQNPTKGQLTVNSIELSVFIGTKYIGRANMASPTTIQASTKTELPINVTIGYLDLISAAKTTYKNAVATKTVDVTLDGFVYSSGLKIPMKNTFNFTLPF